MRLWKEISLYDLSEHFPICLFQRVEQIFNHHGLALFDVKKFQTLADRYGFMQNIKKTKQRIFLPMCSECFRLKKNKACPRR